MAAVVIRGTHDNRWIFILVSVVFCLTITMSGQTPSPVSFFGQHFSSPNSNWMSAPGQIGAMGKCAGATWPWIESSNGVYNWSTLDGCDGAALSHGVSYFESDDCTSSSSPAGCTNGIPNWTSCSSLATDYGNFIQAKVNRYGTKMIYELWNEPETVGCSISQFVAAINRAHDVIRASCPSCKILAPSFGSSMMHNFYANGGTQDVDAWTVHIYTNPNPNPGMPENLVSMISGPKNEMKNWPAVNSKPLWLTEGSAYVNYNGSGIPAAGTRGAYIARYHLLLLSQGVSRVYWYRYDDPQYGPIMQYPDAVTAYVQTENWMVGSTMTKPCTASGTVYTCGLTLANGKQAVAVWNTAGSSTYSIGTGVYGDYRDLAGGTTSISAGATTVSVGIQPILLEGIAGTPTPAAPTGLTATVQ
jgi:hypothetical protein